MEKNNQPLVSVVIPCYNHEQFVQDSIQSVIDQSYQNIELIIIDDGSKDNSVEIIEHMISACEQRFVRFEFRNRPNKGLSATLNESIEWASGDYWTTCSSDDFYHKDKILKQIEFFSKNSKLKFCITQAFVIDDLNNILDMQTKKYNENIFGEVSFKDIFTFKVHLPVTGMYLLDLIENELKGFDTKLTAEDYDINLRLSLLTDIGIVGEKLYYYRSPEAIGMGRKRMPVRMDVSESHLITINKYKGHQDFNEALQAWNNRRFIFFSSYASTKKYALGGMFHSFNMLSNIYFYRSFAKLVLCWKV